MAYPATYSVTPPEQFDKTQVALRITLTFALVVLQSGSIFIDPTFLTSSFLMIDSMIFSAAYLVLPMMAAVLVSQKGADQYLADSEQGPTKWLRYLMGFYSYMALATDKLPTSAPEESVGLHVQPVGTPTVGSALARIILAIPHAIILAVLGIVFAFCWLVAAVAILISGSYPSWVARFIQGYLQWTARVMVYMASLVDEYPPFTLRGGDEESPAAPAQATTPTG